MEFLAKVQKKFGRVATNTNGFRELVQSVYRWVVGQDRDDLSGIFRLSKLIPAKYHQPTTTFLFRGHPVSKAALKKDLPLTPMLL